MKTRETALGICLTLVTAISSTGCYKTTFVDNASTAKNRTTHEEWTDHYVFGLVGDEKYDASKWCPNGTSMVRTGGNLGTGVVTVVTLGIYAPRKIYVTCEDSRTSAASEVKP